MIGLSLWVRIAALTAEKAFDSSRWEMFLHSPPFVLLLLYGLPVGALVWYYGHKRDAE